MKTLLLISVSIILMTSMSSYSSLAGEPLDLRPKALRSAPEGKGKIRSNRAAQKAQIKKTDRQPLDLRRHIVGARANRSQNNVASRSVARAKIAPFPILKLKPQKKVNGTASLRKKRKAKKKLAAYTDAGNSKRIVKPPKITKVQTGLAKKKTKVMRLNAEQTSQKMKTKPQKREKVTAEKRVNVGASSLRKVQKKKIVTASKAPKCAEGIRSQKKDMNEVFIKKYCKANTKSITLAKIAWQRAKLKKIGSQLDGKITILNKKVAAYQTLLKSISEQRRLVKERVVKIYVAMRPDAAAVQLSRMEEDTAIKVLSLMDAKRASLIMNEMHPPKAAKLAELLLNKPLTVKE